MYKNAFRLAVCALAGSLLMGCASTKDLAQVRQMAQQAKSDAASATDTANEAKATAEQAMNMSKANEERLNRMYKRSMMK